MLKTDLTKFLTAIFAAILVLVVGLVGITAVMENQVATANGDVKELLLSGKTAAAKQAKQTAKEAKLGDQIIAKVEGQLMSIIARSGSNHQLTSDVRAILCDSLLFDEADPKVKALAAAMIRQSCGSVKLPTLPGTK